MSIFFNSASDLIEFEIFCILPNVLYVVNFEIKLCVFFIEKCIKKLQMDFEKIFSVVFLDVEKFEETKVKDGR